MDKKAWIIFAAVCVAILGGLIFLQRSNQLDVSAIDETRIIAPNDKNGNIGDHVFGTTTGKAILIEYGDFQCPACKSAHPNVKELTEKYKDQMTFIFRNLPLTTMHPNARAAASAAEAAGLQGKYWEMHNTLYEQQNNWGSASAEQRTSYFEGYAKTIGVKNSDTFKTDMDSKRVASKINFDMALAKKIDATATPTILLNGKKIESDIWSDKDKFEAEIKAALK